MKDDSRHVDAPGIAEKAWAVSSLVLSTWPIARLACHACGRVWTISGMAMLIGMARICGAVEVPVAPDPIPGSMASDGRIEKPTLPDDLPNRERWRFTPEVRLKPGNILQRELVSSFIVPDVEFSSDIGITLGIAVADFDFLQERRREFAEFYVSHSTEGQEDYEMTWKRYLHAMELPGQGVIVNERGAFTGHVEYLKTLTSRFYGLGPRTTEDQESSYTDEVTGLSMRWEDSVPRPGDDCLLSAGMRADYHNLARGHVQGVPSSEVIYPQLVAEGDAQSQWWATAAIRYDTRDSIENPYAGLHIGIDEAILIAGSGKQPGALTTLRGGMTQRVPPLWFAAGIGEEEDPPTDTLAIGCFVQWVNGHLPLYDLPSLGGPSTLRGYIDGRWTDRAAWHASLEYRTWILPRGFHITESIEVERIGLVPFLDVGTVAGSIKELPHSPVKSSFGLGLRLALDRTSIVRVDVGRSREGEELIIAYGLAF